MIGCVLATWALAAVLLGGWFDRASREALLGVEGLAAVLISGTLLALDDPTSGFALFYVCLAPYAFASAPPRRGWVLVGLIAVLYGAVLAVLVAGEPDGGDRGRDRRPLARRRRRQRGARPVRPPAGDPAARERGSLPARLHGLARRDGDPQRGLALARRQRRAVPDARPAARGARRPLARASTPIPTTSRSAARWSTAARRGVRHQHFIKRYLRPDGEVVWAAVESIWVPARRGDGWFYAHVQDITAERAAQEAIERQLAPAGDRRRARPPRARGAGPRGGDGPGRGDGRRDARRRSVRRVGGHAARLGAAPRGGPRLARRTGAARARPRRSRDADRLHAERGAARPHRRGGARRDFVLPAPLAAAGVVSGVTVPVAARDAAWGVLGAHCRTPRGSSGRTRSTSSAPSPTSSPARWSAISSRRRSAIARCTTR